MSQAVEVVGKSDFARRCNVTPGRVSQWISEGKLTGAALVGEGRSARIDVTEAMRQLGDRLDLTQRLGLNGITTRIDAPAVSPLAATPIPQPDRPTSVEDQIKAERLKQEQIRTRRLEEEERANLGFFTPADEARRAAGQIAGTMISSFEASLPRFAQAVAAKFKVASRDVLHLLRDEFRTVREKTAAEMAQAADTEPDLIDGDAGEPRQDRLAGDGDGLGAAAAG